MPNREHNYEVDIPEIKSLLQRLGRQIKGLMPPGWGFNLLIFSYGEKGAMFYLSSANREDMIKAMKEFINKEENHG